MLNIFIFLLISKKFQKFYKTFHIFSIFILLTEISINHFTVFVDLNGLLPNMYTSLVLKMPFFLVFHSIVYKNSLRIQMNIFSGLKRLSLKLNVLLKRLYF